MTLIGSVSLFSPEVSVGLVPYINHQRHHFDAPPMPRNNSQESFGEANTMAPCSNTWIVETAVSSFENLATVSMLKPQSELL